MKVLILATCYPRRGSPHAGVFTHRHAVAMAEQGVDCRVLQPVEGAPPAPLHLLHGEWRRARRASRDLLPSVEGIPVQHPPVVRCKPSRIFPGDWWEQCGRAVARHVARRPDLRDADVMYAQFLCHEGFAAVVARETLGIPVAAVALGDDVHAWPERWPDRIGKLRRVLNEADGLLACSRSLARDAAGWAGPKWDRPVDVVYMGVDTDAFHPATTEERRAAKRGLGLPEQGRAIVTVARPQAAKGWPELLDAFAAPAIARLGWTLLAIAPRRAADEMDLAAEAAARGLGATFRLLDGVAPGNVPGVLRAADAFVLASRNEGLSNAVVEALASGLPVVATRVGGHDEVIRDGEDGILVPPSDGRALVDALGRVMGDPATAARLAARAPAATARVGTVRENAARLRAVLEGVAGRGRRTRGG